MMVEDLLSELQYLIVDSLGFFQQIVAECLGMLSLVLVCNALLFRENIHEGVVFAVEERLILACERLEELEVGLRA